MIKKAAVAVLVVVVLLITASAVYVWRRPMSVFTHLNRRALIGGGLAKVNVASPAGVQVAFVGGQGPALVFIHGAGDQAGTWSKVAPSFTTKHRVIVLDLPGHGESAPASGPLEMATVLAGASAVLDREAAERPVTIIGNSLGAWVALLYSREHPDRVLRVILVNGGSMRANRPDITFLPADREQARKLFDNITGPGSPRVPDFVLDDIVREANRGPLKRLADGSRSMPEFVIEGDKLRDIRVPVDLLWGDADRVFTLEYAQRMQTELRTARLNALPRCGHVPQQECPVTFTATLETVLNQAPPESKR